MNILFNYIKSEVIECVLKKMKKDSKVKGIIIDMFKIQINSLDNLTQLSSFIEKKLKNHHKNLLKRGIKHQEFKKFEYKYNKRAYELMLGMNIPINIIFNILTLDHKKRKKHIINNYPNLAKLMTDEDLSPFNLKQKAFKKSKKEQENKKKPHIIFTPMGNKR